MEERALRQKSKFLRAREGDVNSKLFYKLMNSRKANNFISKLEKVDGTLLDLEDFVIVEVLSFFKNLYTSNGGGFRGFNGVEWSPISASLAE